MTRDDRRKGLGLRRLLKVVGVAVVVGVALNLALRSWFFSPTAPPESERGLSLGGVGGDLEVVARHLEIPWEVAFLPGGDLLVTERPGRLVRISPDGARRWSVPVPDVAHRSEGGLLGLALHPRFADTRWIYLYLTTSTDNRIERWTLDDLGGLRDRLVLVGGIPASGFHNGGRLAFGPDGMLYATTGDAGVRSRAQDTASLGGKILRMTDEGRVPEENPFGSLVWSLGHRNPQGLAWDEQGRLWATEHGRSGLSSGLDEVNRIEAGANYGWPDLQGDAEREGYVGPVLHSGEEYTWAPSGAAWADGRLFFGGLRGQAVYEVRLQGGRPRLRGHFFGELGRIRQVARGPDGRLYILTNNRDGRGRPGRDDDRILSVDPSEPAGPVERRP